MSNKNLKLITRYLHRFLEGPVFTRQKWVAFWRYAGEVCSLVYEKIAGVDYSMVYYTKDENEHHSVYTKVPDKVLKRIFADVQNIENKGFIDVGCGKCYAVTRAAQCGFKRYGGVEYTKILYDTGVQCHLVNIWTKSDVPLTGVHPSCWLQPAILLGLFYLKTLHLKIHFHGNLVFFSRKLRWMG